MGNFFFLIQWDPPFRSLIDLRKVNFVDPLINGSILEVSFRNATYINYFTVFLQTVNMALVFFK